MCQVATQWTWLRYLLWFLCWTLYFKHGFVLSIDPWMVSGQPIMMMQLVPASYLSIRPRETSMSMATQGHGLGPHKYRAPAPYLKKRLSSLALQRSITKHQTPQATLKIHNASCAVLFFPGQC